MRRRRVDRLATGDDTDVDGHTAREIGQPVHGNDLVREFGDGADAFFEGAAGMRGLTEYLKAHEYAALAPGYDVAAGSAGLGVENAAGSAGDPFDDGPR